MAPEDKKPRKKIQGLALWAFISKLAKTVGSDGISIKGETQSIIHQLLVGFLEQFVFNFNQVLSIPSSKKTIKVDQARSVIELSLGYRAGDLAAEVLTEVDRAVAAASTDEGHGLIFAVPRTSRYFKTHLAGYCDTSSKGPKKFKVTPRRLDKGMGVCVTAMLQALCFRILSRAADRIAEGKRTRLIPRELYLSIQEDPALAHIFRTFMTQGGVTETSEGRSGRGDDGDDEGEAEEKPAKKVAKKVVGKKGTAKSKASAGGAKAKASPKATAKKGGAKASAKSAAKKGGAKAKASPKSAAKKAAAKGAAKPKASAKKGGAKSKK